MREFGTAGIVGLAMAAVLTVMPAPGVGADEAPPPASGQGQQGDRPCVLIYDGSEVACIPKRPKTIFVTSGRYDGNLQAAGMGLNGLQGADNICNAHAVNGIVPPGHYVAWLSTDDKHARDRLPPNRSGYALPDGTLVAADKAALLNAETVDLLHSIDQDEFGDPVEGQVVWTGTGANGARPVTGYNCYDWTLNEPGVEAGTAGATSRTNRGWTIQWSVTCAAEQRLYCIER